MTIWLRFGFSHTIVARKASVYLNVCAETADLLGINIHVLSRENHDPMIVECINRFLNSCLTIFCNDRGTTKVAQEGIFMSLCAWNSTPVITTDISRSKVVVGRKFKFTIDYSIESHHTLTSNPKKVASYAGEQAALLAAGREIAREIIHQHCTYHREYINSRRLNQCIYSFGAIVFGRRSIK